MDLFRRYGFLKRVPGKRNTKNRWTCALCDETYKDLHTNALPHWLHEEGIEPCSFRVKEPTREQMQALRDAIMHDIAPDTYMSAPSTSERVKKREANIDSKNNGKRKRNTQRLQGLVELLLDFSDRLPINAIREPNRPQDEWNEWSRKLCHVSTPQGMITVMFWCAESILPRYFRSGFDLESWKEKCHESISLPRCVKMLERLLNDLEENLEWDQIEQLWLVADHVEWTGWQSNVTGPSATCEACRQKRENIGELTRVGEQIIIHIGCLDWLQRKHPQGHMSTSLPQILHDCKKRICNGCGKAGATIPCATTGCQKHYHYPCTLDSGCAMLETEKLLFCDEHAHLKDIGLQVDSPRKSKEARRMKEARRLAKCANIMDEAKGIPLSEKQLQAHLKWLRSVLGPGISADWCKNNARLFMQFRHFLDEDVFPDMLREEIAKCLFGTMSNWEVHSLSRKLQTIISKHQDEVGALSTKLLVGNCLGSKIVLVRDISYGMEQVQIPVVIEITSTVLDQIRDGKQLPQPKDFQYLRSRVILDKEMRMAAQSSKMGCSCEENCCLSTNREICQHFAAFREDFLSFGTKKQKEVVPATFYNRFGRLNLNQAGTFIYECNDFCACSTTCTNRVAQQGIKLNLQVEFHESKGWCVMTREAIKRGAFVCEYAGETINTVEAERRGLVYDKHRCSFLYNLDFHVSRTHANHTNQADLEEDHDLLAIDATFYGNVARFINHSCNPNLIAFPVLWDSMDFRLPHICFFSTKDIASGEELCYDYHYSLKEDDRIDCHCGATNCRGRLL